MRQSRLFTKTRKDAPKDEVSKNAQLLIRAGFVHKEMAGVYSYLPLGLRVFKKIEQIIREEMNAIGGQEIILTALQEKTAWEATGRWDDAVVDNWFKTKLKNDTELGLAYTHEPAITIMMKDYIHSYRDLPAYPYQIQTKFRNELRAKSGLFRGREFVMKDMYSFCRTQDELDLFYDKAIEAYTKIFQRLGIGDRTYITMASGGTFGTRFSHEFQTVTSAGEDTIYIDKKKRIAVNKEVYNAETLESLGLRESDLFEEKSIEIGNIYKLGTFYSAPLNLTYNDESGASKPVIMGSYGIGLGRVMGTIAEIFADEKGMVWPESVAPFGVHLVSLCKEMDDISKADEIYEFLQKKNVEVLYDDREEASAGTKFADSDLIGIPLRVVISPKMIEKNSVEIKKRKEDGSTILERSKFLSSLRS